MVFVVYRSNDNRLTVWGRAAWMVCHYDCKHSHQRQYTNFMGMSNKESVIVNTVIYSRKGRRIMKWVM